MGTFFLHILVWTEAELDKFAHTGFSFGGAARSFLSNLHWMNGYGGLLHSCIHFCTASDTPFHFVDKVGGRSAGGIFDDHFPHTQFLTL